LIVVQFIFYLRSTFLPFARFVGGLLMISRQLLPFLIVSMMLIAAFVYIFWMSQRIQCDTLVTCMQSMMSTIFAFSPEESESGLLDFLFCLLIVVVLLNVVIAIVSESWAKAATNSNMLFWKYRLQKVGESEILKKCFRESSTFSLLRYIDDLDKISYSTSIIWSNPPYDRVTSLCHYDKPEDYFDHNIARKIRAAKSLQSDLYWNKIDKIDKVETSSKSTTSDELTMFETVRIIFRWLCKCVFYILLVIIGMITGGIFVPKDFRSSLISIGIRNAENDELSESNQMCVHPNISMSSNKDIISQPTLDNGTISLPPPPLSVPPTISLPQGWQAIVDPKSFRIYYANFSTGRTSWVPPKISKKDTGKEHVLSQNNSVILIPKQHVLGQNNSVILIPKQNGDSDKGSNTNGDSSDYAMNLFKCF